MPDVSDGLTREAHRLAYRGLDHGALRSACINSSILRRLPPTMRGLADTVPLIQAKRHIADYDPAHAFALEDVIDDIDRCERVIADFLAAPEADRRAFVAFVLFRAR